VDNFPFQKKPAFFPFVTAEVFFDAEDADVDATALGLAEKLDAELEAELDDVLQTT